MDLFQEEKVKALEEEVCDLKDLVKILTEKINALTKGNDCRHLILEKSPTYFGASSSPNGGYHFSVHKCVDCGKLVQVEDKI